MFLSRYQLNILLLAGDFRITIIRTIEVEAFNATTKMLVFMIVAPYSEQ